MILHAIIAKDGTIQKLEYVSGPPLLMRTAMDAVKQWRYRPTMLNGEPVEVEHDFRRLYFGRLSKAVLQALRGGWGGNKIRPAEILLPRSFRRNGGGKIMFANLLWAG